MRRTLFLTLAFLVALLLVAPVAGQAQAAVTLNNAQERLSVGDPLALSVTVTHTPGTTVLFPDLEGEWGSFTVVEQGAPRTETGTDGSLVTTQQIDARLFAPGDFLTPPLTVQVVDPAGNLQDVQAAPVSVSITSVLTPEDQALRDIKPQAALPDALPVLLAALLVAGIAGAGVYLWQRRQRTLPPVVDSRQPHEVALDELDRIAAQGVPAAGAALLAYHDLISGCLRRYLERAFQVPALERTTYELERALRVTSIEAEARQQVIALLDACDLVKFANVAPDRAEAEAVLTGARQFVLATRAGMTVPDDAAGPSFSENGHRQETEVLQ